jgi:hypothetical protein
MVLADMALGVPLEVIAAVCDAFLDNGFPE